MKIAILGYGTVGSGVYEIITNGNTEELKKLEVKSVFARSRDKMHLATDDINEIINDEEILVVVECLGGLNPAYDFIKRSLENGKHVVTANKAVAAKYLDEFVELAEKNNVKFIFEANGTSNFILDNMYRNDQEFDSTLKTAQDLGYAEADPSADVDGGDVVNKIILSNALAFDIHVQPDFPTYSMRNITKNDIDYLKQYDLAVKYIGETNVEGGKYETSVMLSIFGKESQEAAVPLNNNIISLDGSFIGELKFYGQGAGKFPTGNAIVQDIVDINEGSTRVDVVIKNDLSYSEELTRRNYLVRTSVELSGELVESVEQYKGNFYVKTKEISLKQLTNLVDEVKEKDSSFVVAKFHK